MSPHPAAPWSAMSDSWSICRAQPCILHIGVYLCVSSWEPWPAFPHSISNITLTGTGYNSSATTMQYSIICESISNSSIQWLLFDLTKINSRYQASVLIKVSNSRDITISSCTFQGSERLVQQHCMLNDLISQLSGVSLTGT